MGEQNTSLQNSQIPSEVKTVSLLYFFGRFFSPTAPQKKLFILDHLPTFSFYWHQEIWQLSRRWTDSALSRFLFASVLPERCLRTPPVRLWMTNKKVTETHQLVWSCCRDDPGYRGNHIIKGAWIDIFQNRAFTHLRIVFMSGGICQIKKNGQNEC